MTVAVTGTSAGSIKVEYIAIVDSGSAVTPNDVQNAIRALQVAAPASGLAISPDPADTFARGKTLWINSSTYTRSH